MQEKLTSVSVNAMRKMLSRPVAFSALPSTAAPHVPLYQAVHGFAGAEVGKGLPHRPLLGSGEGEGQGGVVFRRVIVPALRPQAPAAPALEQGQTQGEEEQLLKDQPPPVSDQLSRSTVSTQNS